MLEYMGVFRSIGRLLHYGVLAALADGEPAMVLISPRAQCSSCTHTARHHSVVGGKIGEYCATLPLLLNNGRPLDYARHEDIEEESKPMPTHSTPSSVFVPQPQNISSRRRRVSRIPDRLVNASYF